MVPVPLPVDDVLPEVVARLEKHRRLVVVAPPGAGKSTRIPPALTEAGPVILLQPRRMAARALARRIADERAWSLGEEVGWQVRFERRFGPKTKLLVATEGILTARLREDPLLEDFATILLDEFHERSMYADLAVAMAKEAVEARDDLRLVVMSATLDAERVAEFLGGCPVIQVEARAHPIEVAHAPGVRVAAAVRDELDRSSGDVLAFLPGVREIRAAHKDLQGLRGVAVHPLYGGLSADDQDAAIRPSAGRKVVLSTNLAETSLTVEGVTCVVDSGLQKVMRYDPGVGLDRLETERISRDSADQRAGRAGRLGPGRAVRLWDSRDELRPHREPDVRRIDLASTLLDLFAWGGSPESFGWFEAPPPVLMDAGLELLEALGALRGSPRKLTARGQELARLPLAPRLGVLMLEAGGGEAAARLGAILSEGGRLSQVFGMDRAAASESDALVMLDRFDRAPGSVRRAANQLARRTKKLARGDDSEAGLRRALLAAFPDRVAQRRRPGEPRLKLASGHGALLARESTVHRAEYLVALDVAARRGQEALVRVASAIDPQWLEPTDCRLEHRLAPDGETVRAFEVRRYYALILDERPATPEPEEAAALLARTLRDRLDDFVPAALRARLDFAGITVDLDSLCEAACFGQLRLPRFDLLAALPYALKQELDRQAPTRLALPSGRTAALEYRSDGSVQVAAKLQEFFGLTETPRLGPLRRAVTISMLSPGGRPAAVTDDLASFWVTGYPVVRKDLRGRYPKHPWPEDPQTAAATHRAKPRKR